MLQYTILWQAIIPAKYDLYQDTHPVPSPITACSGPLKRRGVKHIFEVPCMMMGLHRLEGHPITTGVPESGHALHLHLRRGGLLRDRGGRSGRERHRCLLHDCQLSRALLQPRLDARHMTEGAWRHVQHMDACRHMHAPAHHRLQCACITGDDVHAPDASSSSVQCGLTTG